MGSSEMDKSSKEGKEAKEPKVPTSQEQPSATVTGTVTGDWSGFQAYSPVPPHGFLASSPQAHPYMWGIQQFMPPYGTPPHPYVTMYPHGGIYTHPTMPPGSYPFSPFAMSSPNGIAEASGNAPGNMEVNAPGNMEVNGKPSEGKEKLPIKRSKGRLGSLKMITGKNSEPGKASGESANGVFSKSAESASEGSSERSDENSQNESQMKSRGQQDSGEASQNGSGTHGSHNEGPNTPHSMVNQQMPMMSVSGGTGGVPGPTTNLNIGMDYWAAAQPSAIPAMRGKVPSAPVAGGMVTAGSRDNVQSQLWIQDERELKRQRRKQSNRESARRSRLRKQSECDELAQRAEAMKEENSSLRAEVTRLRSEYEQLLAQNVALKERLGEDEDPRSSRDDQSAGRDSEYTRQAEHIQSGQ